MNTDFRLYLAVGYTDIAEKFIIQCSTKQKCVVSESLEQQYTPHFLTTGQQHLEYPPDWHVAESNAHDFANLITIKL